MALLKLSAPMKSMPENVVTEPLDKEKKGSGQVHRMNNQAGSDGELQDRPCGACAATSQPSGAAGSRGARRQHSPSLPSIHVTSENQVSGERKEKQGKNQNKRPKPCSNPNLKIVSGLIKAQSNRRSKADIFLRDDRRAKSNRMEQSLFSQIGQNNGGPMSPASPQALTRTSRELQTEGAAQPAEMWRGQIRGQRHREALSPGPRGKFAVIKRR
ncbi:uncharacterized protein [Nothobranchius furzeri]|uniref:uncharacterized protein n=1 Tax=Nothobranchius furzeri TaxID=105023 RepID=UPI003904BB06